MKKYAHIVATGSYVPEKVLSDFELEKMIETSDEWIITRTGIKNRHISTKEIASSNLATRAAQMALNRAGVGAEDIDPMLLASVTPDKPLPSTACIVQDNLRAVNAGVMDIVAACSGYVVGPSVANAMIESSQCDSDLMIGVETLSEIFNWQDHDTCVLSATVQVRR